MPQLSMPALLALLTFAFVMSITPGPNNIMLWVSGANFGLRRSLPHLFGIVLGFASLVILCALGLGMLFEAFPMFQSGLRVVGVLYLLYLAYRLASASLSAEDTLAQPLNFVEAAGFQYANPKGWMMALSATSSFVLIEVSLLANAVAVASVFAVVGLPSLLTWALFGSLLARFLKQPRVQKAFNMLMAGLLVATVMFMV